MNSSQTDQTAADSSASDQGIRTRIRLVATPARMTRQPARVARQAIAAAAPIRVQPMAVDRVQRTRPVVARMAVDRVGPTMELALRQ
jgi:hypothetical protein